MGFEDNLTKDKNGGYVLKSKTTINSNIVFHNPIS